MKLLLDTVGLLCAGFERSRLSDAVVDLLVDRDNEVFASAASAWEVSTKFRRGRLRQAAPLVADWDGECERLGFGHLPISSEHALRSGAYRMEHRDPFDRMICAQGELDGLTIVTNDPAFATFPVTTVW